jgi:hypothetical protein
MVAERVVAPPPSLDQQSAQFAWVSLLKEMKLGFCLSVDIASMLSALTHGLGLIPLVPLAVRFWWWLGVRNVVIFLLPPPPPLVVVELPLEKIAMSKIVIPIMPKKCSHFLALTNRENKILPHLVVL